MSFEALGLSAPLLRSLNEAGYITPTEIQAKAIPPALEGRDVLGCAQTGTGKTAAFALPLIQRLAETFSKKNEAKPEQQPDAAPAPQKFPKHRRPNNFRTLKALVLAPTRELAVQIADSIHDYSQGSNLRLAAVFGGVSYHHQIQAFQKGVDILVATPGRLLDLLTQGYGDLSTVQMLVLDEADRMLDMGFMPDIRDILGRMPKDRQTLFFSATMPNEIAKLANEMLRNPARVNIIPEQHNIVKIEQTLFFIPKKQKARLLMSLISDRNIDRGIVFTRTKRDANKVAESLNYAGIKADAIHGNKSQNARLRTLDGFRANRVRILVATDVAARGIDVTGISHVINFDMPTEPETYTHRIGRTARAGASGSAISFCDRDEKGKLRAIERLLRINIPVEKNIPFDLNSEPPEMGKKKPARHKEQGRNRDDQGRNRRDNDGFGMEREIERQIEEQSREGQSGERHHSGQPHHSNNRPAQQGKPGKPKKWNRDGQQHSSDRKPRPAFGQQGHSGGREDNRPKHFGPKKKKSGNNNGKKKFFAKAR